MTEPAPTRHTQRREATRAELIRLGLERIPVKGYSATTIDDLVAGTDISRATWYFHFGDKEAYFFELLHRRSELRGQWWRIATDERFATLDEILGAVFGHFRELEGERHDWIVVIVDFWEHVKHKPDQLRALHEFHRKNLGEVAQFIDTLRARGMVESRADSAALAQAVFAVAQGEMVHRDVYAGGFSPIPAIKAVLTAF